MYFLKKWLKNIFKENELQENSVVSQMETTASDGKKYLVSYYNLDAIIAVGYRVNSKQTTQFRIWATQTLREFITKGFVINDEMLKNGRPFGKDYFDELLERIREIRASERRAYQKITDVFEQCSAAYSPDSDDARLLFPFRVLSLADGLFFSFFIARCCNLNEYPDKTVSMTIHLPNSAENRSQAANAAAAEKPRAAR